MCVCFQISDVDNIMGVVNTEPIQVIAEAYDVALDMSFPKGRISSTVIVAAPTVSKSRVIL